MMTTHKHPEFDTPAVIINNAFDQSQCQQIIETYKDKTEGATHISGNNKIVNKKREKTILIKRRKKNSFNRSHWIWRLSDLH